MRTIALIVLLGCLCVAEVALAAWPESPYSNVAVSATTGRQQNPRAVSDGAGGAIVVWEDTRSGTSDIYAQRISAAGVPLWTANGVPVCTAAQAQTAPQIAVDGFGGAVITWQDGRTPANGDDIYAQRIKDDGGVVWSANGVPVCVVGGAQEKPQIVTAAGGGAIIVWQDQTGAGPSYNLYVQRLSGAGAPQWTVNGTLVCGAANDQTEPVLCSDAAGGAIMAWQDARAGFATEDVFAQRVLASGTMAWTPDGVSMVSATSQQVLPRIIADGEAGAILVWNDLRVGPSSSDVYAQRVTSAGARLWGTAGSPVSTASGQQFFPRLVSDGQGGAIVTWIDQTAGGGSEDIRAQRVNSSGQSLWVGSGVPVCTANLTQTDPEIASDGAGSAVIAWSDGRLFGPYDIYAQRLSATGASQWTSQGVLLSGAFDNQRLPMVVSNGDAGAIVVWQDERSGNATPDVYAQRVERYGQIGQPEPAITAVRDVAADQGGALKVAWNRSPLDADPTYGIVEYRLWRSAPVSLKAARATSADADEAAAKGLLLVGPFAAQGYSWQLVATQVADALPAYELVTATTSDSSAAGNPFTVYMVEARASTSIAGARWYSQPDSGYSVDDLAPPAPTPFTGSYTGAVTYLAWGAVPAPDLAGYRLYRGTTPGFTPDPGSLLATLTDTHYDDAAGGPYFYKLVAVDVHGNVSPVAVLIPDGVLDAPGGGQARVAMLDSPTPNPVLAHGRATLRYALPRAGHAELSLLDPQGRMVRTLARGEHAAGEHTAVLSGGALAPGVYLARLEAQGVRLTRRVVILQ